MSVTEMDIQTRKQNLLENIRNRQKLYTETDITARDSYKEKNFNE